MAPIGDKMQPLVNKAGEKINPIAKYAAGKLDKSLKVVHDNTKQSIAALTQIIK